MTIRQKGGESSCSNLIQLISSSRPYAQWSSVQNVGRFSIAQEFERFGIKSKHSDDMFKCLFWTRGTWPFSAERRSGWKFPTDRSSVFSIRSTTVSSPYQRSIFLCGVNRELQQPQRFETSNTLTSFEIKSRNDKKKYYFLALKFGIRIPWMWYSTINWAHLIPNQCCGIPHLEFSSARQNNDGL